MATVTPKRTTRRTAASAVQPQTNAFVGISVQDYFKSQNVVGVLPAVRSNENGYPFIVIMKADNTSETIYFSKKAAETVAEGEPIEKGFFDSFQIAETENADGEARVKLALIADDVIDVADLF